MKLGEALTIRSDLQKRIAQLGGRVASSAVVQEGDAPPEDPATRHSRSELRMERLLDVAAVRRRIDDLAKRRRELDTEIQEHNWTTELVDHASL